MLWVVGLAASAETYYLQAYSFITENNPDYQIQVVREGESIRIQGLYQALPEAWIEGTMVDNRATFPSGQQLAEGVYMSCSTDMKTTQPLQFEYNPLNDTYEGYYQYLVFSTAPDFSAAGEEGYQILEQLQNMTFFSGSKSLTTLPAKMEVMAYRLEGIDSDTEKQVSYNVNVGAYGDEFYIQGLCSKLPEAWVKGVYNPQTEQITFMRNQYMGQTEVDVHTLLGIVRKTFDIWFTGIDEDERFMAPVVFNYDAESGKLQALTKSWMVFNGEPTKLHYLQILREVALTPVGEGGGGGDDLYALVTPPTELKTSTFQVTRRDLTFTERGETLTPYEVQCGVEDGTLYIQGLFPDIPEAWVKGDITRSAQGAVATFPAVQYVGSWYGQMDSWMPVSDANGAMDNFTMTVEYAAATPDSPIATLRLPAGLRLSFTDNPNEEGLMPFSIYTSLVLGNTSLTGIQRIDNGQRTTDNGQRTTDNRQLSALSSQLFDLQGRSYVRQPKSRLFIQNGRVQMGR